MNYLLSWIQAYVMHFGAWVVFCIVCTIYRDGVPEDLTNLPKLLKISLILSAILSLFSSHSHLQYLTQFVK